MTDFYTYSFVYAERTHIAIMCIDLYAKYTCHLLFVKYTNNNKHIDLVKLFGTLHRIPFSKSDIEAGTINVAVLLFCSIFITYLRLLFYLKNIFGYSLLRCVGFSMQGLLLLPSTGSRHTGFSSYGSRAPEHRLNSCDARA